MVKGFVEKIAKAVLKLIMPDVTEHLLRVFKLDKMVDYMELPNEADIKIGKLEERVKMMVQDSHPPIEDLTKRLNKLEEVTNKVKKLRAFKSIG